MGCGGSTPEKADSPKPSPQQQAAQKKKSLIQNDKAIKAKIKDAKKVEDTQLKILLLGGGESGKSTILKQMKILHTNGFTDADKAHAKKMVIRNTLEIIQSLATACRDLKIPYENPEVCDPIAAKMIDIDISEEDVDPSVATEIQTLYADKGLKSAFDKNDQFHLLDNATYFLDKVVDMFKPDYQPSTQDILRVRSTTTGIVETAFKKEDTLFKVYDVGGQRGERKKWVHVFEEVTAIMYIASLADYNLTLIEDPSRNRMAESLDLFEGLVSQTWFKDTAIFLFLNKDDIFKEKVSKVDMGKTWPKYTGGHDYEKAKDYIEGMYRDRDPVPTRSLFTHVTDATNTKNIDFVWEASKKAIIENRIKASGLA